MPGTNAVFFEVYDVPKRCGCGIEWTGKSFQPISEGEKLPRSGICEACLNEEETRIQELRRRPVERGAPITDLQPPQETREPF